MTECKHPLDFHSSRLPYTTNLFYCCNCAAVLLTAPPRSTTPSSTIPHRLKLTHPGIPHTPRSTGLAAVLSALLSSSWSVGLYWRCGMYPVPFKWRRKELQFQDESEFLVRPTSALQWAETGGRHCRGLNSQRRSQASDSALILWRSGERRRGL